MKKIHLIYMMSVMLADLMLASCVAQTADPPLPTVASTSTTSAALTADSGITKPSITTSAEITTPDGTTADQTEPVITPGVTDSETPPTTGSTPSTSETDPPVTDQPSSTPGTTKQDPVTDSPVSSQTFPASSQKQETSKTPATSKKKETPTPTPHTHSWSSWMVTKAATCTSAGSQRRTCTGCNEVQTQTLSATGHSYSSKVTVSATCAKAGIRTYTCTKCNDAYTESIPATRHSWGEWTVTKAATTEAEGVKTRTCSNCGNTETRSIDKLPQQSATPADTEWMAQRFLELLNEERAKVGAQQLVTSDKLHEMAQVRADELTILFDHYRPDGSMCGSIFNDFEYGNYYDFTQYGLPESYNYYSPSTSGEDIGLNGIFVYNITEDAMVEAIQDMMESFKTSPGHWNDMMNDVYGAVGIAISVEKIEVGDGFPDLYNFYYEVLLVDCLYE